MSELYTTEILYADACGNRAKGSTIHPKQPLKIAYRKFTPTATKKSSKRLVNLFFVHGNGMNKGIWTVHIRELFQRFNGSTDSNTTINTAVAMDVFNQGDSAVANIGKAGYNHDWKDSARDVISIMENEERESFVSTPNVVNILAGHSMGGHIVLVAASYAPHIVGATIPINPVVNIPEQGHYTFTNWFKAGYLRDTFSDHQDYRGFINGKSFFQTFDPVVLKEMLGDDEQVCEDGQIRLKSNTISQLVNYNSMRDNLDESDECYAEIRTPVVYVTSELDFNHYSSEFMRNLITKSRFEHIHLPFGRHVVHAESPYAIVDIIQNTIGSLVRQNSSPSPIKI
ncbi:uncharacterized protein KQ657_001038 [Scheffersomyces spartinae]|uniref:AB hydrolase-1 domain-containing protein n=1 Tax=Scheffersomyces spartinae TaxID=45513 RepID=A0A9P8AI18_9ASCO|nr:uncharacterized protein KQ657_001038 [Scheffersomyces spartinae]KAG7193275.1 hypothetical protein KQ657_001038 [Scheffersomyces spartinae]